MEGTLKPGDKISFRISDGKVTFLREHQELELLEYTMLGEISPTKHTCATIAMIVAHSHKMHAKIIENMPDGHIVFQFD